MCFKVEGKITDNVKFTSNLHILIPKMHSFIRKMQFNPNVTHLKLKAERIDSEVAQLTINIVYYNP